METKETNYCSEYSKEYKKELKKLEVYHNGKKRTLSSKSYKASIDYYNSLYLCTCGGKPKVATVTGMGDLDIFISCCNSECHRCLHKTIYDWDVVEPGDLERIIRDEWNKGLSREDEEEKSDADWERIRIHEEDAKWLPLYQNNDPDDGLLGYYTLLLKKDEDKIKAEKWTILLQKQETDQAEEPADKPVEAYNLFCLDYNDVRGALKYPKPCKNNDQTENGNTFTNMDINNYGKFFRSYRDMEKAKTGAIAKSHFFVKRTMLIGADGQPVFKDLYGYKKGEF